MKYNQDHVKYFNAILQTSEEFIQQNIAIVFKDFTNKNFTFENAYAAYASCGFQDGIFY